MSCFNHEPFGAGHMPPFEAIFDIKQKKNTLRSTISESIEDVEYEEITDEKPKPTDSTNNWDKAARKKEIWDEAMKQAEEMKLNDGRIAITHAILFELGADWADQNPESHFKDEFNRIQAFSEAMDKKNRRLQKNG